MTVHHFLKSSKWVKGNRIKISACAGVQLLHRKKAFQYSRPQPGCHLPNSPWAGIMTSYIKYSAYRESLVIDIPAGDGDIEKVFLRCVSPVAPFVH